MRIFILACVLALGETTALAGESPYNPPSDPERVLMDSCSGLISQAQAGLSMTPAANRSHAEAFLKDARAAMKAKEWNQCSARAQDAIRWERS
jgi:hypothetical protein